MPKSSKSQPSSPSSRPGRKRTLAEPVVGTPLSARSQADGSGGQLQAVVYQSIIDAAMDAIISVDEEQRIVLFNEAAERMFGYAADKVMGQPLDLLMPTRYRKAHRGHVREFGESGVTRRTMGRLGELVGLRAGGEEFPIEVSISQTTIAAKKIFTAIVRDISERQRNELEHTLLASVVESSNDAIISKTLDGVITSWNHAAEQMFGYAAREIIGQSVTVLIPPERQEEEKDILARLRRGEQIRHYETVRLRKDGQPVDLSLTISPIRNAAGEIIGASKIARDISQQKKDEARLKLQEVMLRETGSIAKVGGWRFDVATGEGYWTEEAARIHELDPAKPISRDQGLSYYHGEHRQRIEAAVAEAIERGTPYDLELEIVTAKGHRKWVRTIGCPVIEGGKVVRLRGTLQDISERKQTDRNLQLFRALVDRSNDAFEVIDPATARFLDVNEKAHADIGLTREEMLECTVFDVDTEMTRELWQSLMKKARTEGGYSHEGVHRHKDGTNFPIEVNVKWVRLDRDYVVSVVRDVTERRRAEAALRESNERFREIAENISEVFWITDPDKNAMLYISPAYERIWGRTCQSLYQSPQTWLDAIHLDDRERVRAAAEAKQAKGDYNEVYRITQPDGALRWIHDRAFPLRNAEGRVYRIVGVAEDITNARKLEEQFRQAQKMEAIGTLAGGIAHDFNNILAAVSGYAELCKMKAGEHSPLRDYLDAIAQAGLRATGLVRQILTFSRQQEQQRRPVNLGEIVDETLKLLRATIPSTIEFVVAIAPEVPPVLADPTQIHQILMNLGTNAWHAMRDRQGRLEVKVENFEVDKHFAATRPRLQPGPYVRITVGDTGKGMDQATLERIFEPFFTTKPKGEGTGLGLAVVHGIMESHDGIVTVYSKPNEGTVFHLYFPSHNGQTVESAKPKEPTPLGSGGKRILYVDDEASLAKLGQQTLEQLGYEVEMTTNVSEALEWVRKEPKRFDLIITDQTMPGMTGMDFAAQLLALRPDLPIILTTGYSPYLTRERVHAAGIRDLLLKPHTLHTLGVAVHQALQPRKP